MGNRLIQGAGISHMHWSSTPTVARKRREETPDRPGVAAFGEWNTANLGDRAIHRALVQFFEECGWRVDAYGLGALKPTVELAASGGGAAPARTSYRLPTGLAPGAKRLVRGLRQQYRLLRLLPGLRRIQAISVGGGGLLTDANLHFPQSLAALAQGAAWLNKPIFCLGCSAEGPWSRAGETRIRRFLAACTVVAARDHATAQRLSAVLERPVPVFGDFCLAARHLQGLPRQPTGDFTIAVNVSRLPAPWDRAQQRLEDTLVALVGAITRNALNQDVPWVRIFTTGVAQDVVAAQRVFARIAGPRVELCFPEHLEQLLDLLRKSDWVIASRLHAAILGLAEGLPVIGLSATPKLRYHFETLGLQEFSPALKHALRLAPLTAPSRWEQVLSAQREAMRRSAAWAGREEVRHHLLALAHEFISRPATAGHERGTVP